MFIDIFSSVILFLVLSWHTVQTWEFNVEYLFINKQVCQNKTKHLALTSTGERSFPDNTKARNVNTEAITGTIGAVEELIL